MSLGISVRSMKLRAFLPIASAVAMALLLAPRPAAAEPRIQRSRPVVRADPWRGPDKALHFTASALLAGGGYALGALGTEDLPGRLAVGGALSLSAGVAKETLDAAGLGTPSFKDLAWDVAGIAFGLLFSVAVDRAARPAWFAAGH
ncbi:hypothetical protein [Chondromyces apiculatus]|uniref:Lipoprotein n=1 Tax=Chondromyces apiculatus DSM 436 TaxID=1192034 RepID=A0A017SZF9_9BACT|nr:hypothetical protein [Chondromyces apiculatus]EYF01980.1 Hypothetical protein CAP_7598 [Chondromyces apiculatus DSM 436]